MQLAEYEVFVQYYSKLIELLQDEAYQLYKYICKHWSKNTSHGWLVTYFKVFEGELLHNSEIELVLAIQAIELHSGRTSLLYEMLKFMKSSKEDDHQHLAREIQLNIKRFDPNNSSGM